MDYYKDLARSSEHLNFPAHLFWIKCCWKTIQEPLKKERVPEEKSEKSDSPGKENKASQESSSTTNKPDTKSQKVNGKTTSSKRRKRIQMMSDSDSSDNEETEHNNDYHEPVSELFKKNLALCLKLSLCNFCPKCMLEQMHAEWILLYLQMHTKTAN